MIESLNITETILVLLNLTVGDLSCAPQPQNDKSRHHAL